MNAKGDAAYLGYDLRPWYMSFKTGTIRQKVLIGASPGEVYAAFIDPKKHSAFTGARATGSPKVGGRVTAWDGYISGKNIELKKDRKIVQEWKTSEWPSDYPPSILTLTFERRGKGTLLRMDHSKVPKEQIEEYRQGWHDSYWNPLKKYFSGSRK